MNSFQAWLAKEMPLVAAGAKLKGGNPFKDAHDSMEIAWDAALEAAVRACESRRDDLRWSGHIRIGIAQAMAITSSLRTDATARVVERNQEEK